VDQNCIQENIYTLNFKNFFFWGGGGENMLPRGANCPNTALVDG